MRLLGISHWYVIEITVSCFLFNDMKMMDILNRLQVTQLHNWLSHWHDQFGGTGSKGKGKKFNDDGAKKAVLLSGTPGIGKTTSAKLVTQMLGFQAVEVSSYLFQFHLVMIHFLPIHCLEDIRFYFLFRLMLVTVVERRTRRLPKELVVAMQIL